MLEFNTLNDINMHGKTVLVRVDFNVPISKQGKIQDDTRIKAHLETIEFICDAGAKVVLMSHLGNEGKTLKHVAKHLSILLSQPVKFVDACVGEKVKKVISELHSSSILLLENTRTNTGEITNDKTFSKELADLCDIYVNDAFATAHRAHASTVGVAQFAPQKAIGLLMQKEIETLTNILEKPKQPLLVIIGGAKVSSKLGVLKKLATVANNILIGGAMANTFLKATNVDVGSSMVENSMLGEALNVLKIAKAHNCKILLPSDVTVADKLEKGTETQNPNVNDIEPQQLALDIGKHTRTFWAEYIKNAGTILWNGPAGVFETKPFNLGTKAVAKAISETNAYTVLGGGDTIHAASMFNITDKVNYISTGGGSLLKFIEGDILVALDALKK